LNFPIGKLYIEQRGIPSPIRDDGGLPTNGCNVPISNDSGGPFDIGGNGPPRGGGNRSLRAQNPRSYVKGPIGSWWGLPVIHGTFNGIMFNHL